MDSRQLLQFRIIAQEENLQRAAELLFVSPPALSKTIVALEEELECKLFQRVGKKIVLNENGHKLLPYAEEIFTTLSNAKKAFAEKNEAKFVIISLYFLWYQIIFNNSSILSDYSTLLCESHNTFTMFDKLLDGYVDVIVDYERNNYSKFLRKFLLVEECYAVCVDKEHPWANKTHLELTDINGGYFIDRQNNELWRNEFMNHFNVKYNIIQQLENSTFKKALNESREPLLHMALPPYKNGITQSKRIIPISDCKPRKVYLWWLPGNEEKVKPLIENVKKFYSQNS